jgi:integrase
MAKGENPNKTKKIERQKQITLGEAIENYKKVRKDLSKSTIDRLNRMKNNYLTDWAATPLSDLTRDKVLNRHLKIGEKNGKGAANSTMQALRAVYNFASQTNDYLPTNPVTALSRAKAWYKLTARESLIKPTQLKAWYEAVHLLDNSTIRDYLLLVLFTGMRRSEALGLRWENIDFDEKTLLVPHTKNSKPLALPLSDYVFRLLETRKKKTGKSPWVFPGHGNKSHLAEPKNSMKKVAEWSGVEFMMHDLRRSFITYAESLDIPAYALKALANHSTSGDVTAGYIKMTPDRLRAPMQKVTDFILATVNKKEAKEEKKSRKKNAK